LRRQIKLLQSENSILRKRLNEEEQIDLAAVVTKEIERMNHDELKGKIIKVAQMYRSERMRNEEFEKVIQSAQREVSEAYKFKGELEKLAAKHEDTNRKLQKTQALAEKSNAYRETVKKQERVIAKMEGLLEKTLKDTQQAREAATMLERLKTENLELRKQLRGAALGTGSTSVEQANREVRRLETLVAELQEQLRSKRPVTGDQHSDWEREKMELEIQLQKAELRVGAMQEEMDTNAVKFAKEISHYKALLAEKQSIIDTLQGDYS
jgi:hypothetical protein